jgi:hypothetical protein
MKTSSCKVPIILVGFQSNLNFLNRLSKKKKAQISSLIKIHQVGAELFRADGGTDGHDEANSRFLQFCEKHLKMATMRILEAVFG